MLVWPLSEIFVCSYQSIPFSTMNLIFYIFQCSILQNKNMNLCHAFYSFGDKPKINALRSQSVSIFWTTFNHCLYAFSIRNLFSLIFIDIFFTQFVAQLVEHWIRFRKVMGSRYSSHPFRLFLLISSGHTRQMMESYLHKDQGRFLNKSFVFLLLLIQYKMVVERVK